MYKKNKARSNLNNLTMEVNHETKKECSFYVTGDAR